jgi:hypothetical protein
MWAAWVIAGIALAGVAFMLRFLIALLGEGAPSVCYWVMPARPRAEREILATHGGDGSENDWQALSGQPAMEVAVQGDSRRVKLGGILAQRWSQTRWPGGQIVVRVRMGRAGESW